jgi:glycosyltransferase involved in cell wall biosynthesis
MTDVVLPCLDEAAALPWVLSRIPEGYRAIVADNGSTDGSPEIAAARGAVVVSVPRRGFGAAVHAGVLAAAWLAAGEGTGDDGVGDDGVGDDGVGDDGVVCVLDADGSFDPAQLPRVADPVRAGVADLVLGRRRPTTRGAWPAHARLGNAVIARRLRRTAGIPVHDLGPMRAARRASLLALDLRDRRFGYPLEMVVRAAQAGWRVIEVDVDYAPRAEGTRSKVTGTVRGTVRTVRDMARVLAS